MKLVVTGGAGFIGSCFVRRGIRSSQHEILNLDKLSYAGNLDNVSSVADDPRYSFAHIDISDEASVERVIAEYRPDAIVHFAAESHVDRSILSPEPVFQTNLRGTFVLLEAARRAGIGRFLHVSTDEVYGSIDAPADADEGYPLRPSSPYSASKAGSDLLALSYFHTYRLPVCVSRASNNYGPYQFPEKLIPLMITNALENRPLPVYGNGLQVRDWLYVEDHCRALYTLLERGRPGEVYNIGGNCSLPNLDVVRRMLQITGRPESLIQYVQDRPGHDTRYALSSRKIYEEPGWQPQMTFDEGLRATVEWYQENRTWIERVRSGEYQTFYEQNYGAREALHP